MSTSRVDGGNFESGMHTAGGVEEKDSYGGPGKHFLYAYRK